MVARLKTKGNYLQNTNSFARTCFFRSLIYRFASFEDALRTLRYPYGHPRTGTPPNPHPTQPTPGPPAPAQPARSPAQSTVSSCRRPAPQPSRPLASTRSSCVTKLPTHTPTSSCPHLPPIHISYSAPSLRHPYPCTTPPATYRFHSPHTSIHQSLYSSCRPTHF